MATKGFRESVESRISQLKDNLNDRYYLGFPVVKELLANADDAKATRVHLGWCPSPFGTRHPLLDRPGVFVVNDGPFRSVDENGIRQLGLGSRGADHAAIGRFGLGLKSVFHFCDALFYMASARDGDRSAPVFDLLNPWSHETSGMHAEWDELYDEDGELLRNLLTPCCSTADWFALWLPMRCERDGKPFIMQEFRGDQNTPPEELLGRSVVRRIASLLPLLANVCSVQMWENRAGRGGELVRWAECEMLPGGVRRRSHKALREQIGTGVLGGKIRVGIEGAPTQTCDFVAVEAMLDDPECVHLQEHQKWPHRHAFDPVTLDLIEQPEKAPPHAAVHIIRSASSAPKGELRVLWASYLPVGEPQSSDRRTLECESDYEVVLHGVFFVDAGRRLVDFDGAGSLENERAVRLRWNAMLRERGVLPLLIPALAQAVAAGAVAKDDLPGVTRALTSTAMLKDRTVVAHICREHQWLAVVRSSSPQWSVLHAGAEVLELPMAESLEKTFEACPAIAEVSRRFLLTPANWPRLTGREPARQWPSEALAPVLRSIEDLATISTDLLEVRVDLLCGATDRGFPHGACADAQGFVLALFEHRKLSEFEDKPQLVSCLCERMPADQVYSLPLPCRSNGAAQILAAVNRAGAEHGCLFVPEQLLGSADAPRSSLGLEIACDALRQLAGCETKVKSQPHFARVAASIIRACEASDQLLERCGALSLFRDERGSIDRVWSVHELRSLRTQSAVATRRDDSDRQWQQAVTAAVAADLAFVHSDVAGAIFGDGVPTCNAQWTLSLLSTAPTLAAPSKRAQLLSLLVSSCDLTLGSHRSAVRYLLHGRRLPEVDAAVLLEPRSEGESDVWDRAASMAMDRMGERWRLLDRDLVAQLPKTARRGLTIDSVDADGVGRLLAQVGPEAIDWSQFSGHERAQLLIELRDEALLRRLPIHETVDGRLVALGPTTYRRSPWTERAPDVAALLTLLRDPVDGRARARLSQLVNALDAEAIVRVALRTPAPSLYWTSVMEAAAELLVSRTCPGDLMRLLRSTRWLPTVEGQAVAPEHLIRLPYDAGQVALSMIEGACPLRAISSLQPEVIDHPEFRLCRDELLPPVRDQLTAVASFLATSGAASIGTVDLQKEDTFEAWLGAFEGVGGSAVMPAAELLGQFKSHEHRRLCLDVLVPRLSRSLSDDRLLAVLRHLGASLERNRSGRTGTAWPVYLQYLGVAQAARDPRGIVRRLKLPSQDGSWRGAGELSVDAHGIAPGHLLENECARALGDLLFRSARHRTGEEADGSDRVDAARDVSEQVRLSMGMLEDYFSPWAQVADEELIGALIGLLGDHPALIALRQRFIDTTKLAVFRDSLAWATHDGSRAVGASETLDMMMLKQRFTVRVSLEEAVTVVSVVGDEFEAPVSASASTLLLGDRAPRFVGGLREDGVGVRVYELRLRHLDPTSYGRERCNQILRETARSLLVDVYCRGVANFDEKWDHLASSDQVDLEFTREWLLRQAPLYLEQLGLRTDPVLGPVLRELKDAERQKHLEEHEGVPLQRRKGATREAEARRRLAALLQDDADVATEVRTKVREKLSKKDEYTPDSVPFELFQNADDAATELAQCHAPQRDLRPEERHWVVVRTAGSIAFVHRGRCINQHQLGTADHSQDGFGQDLEKMLVLQSSDKQHGPGAVPVTGKFGLGFKSTFLVSDEPRIWSGRLRCRIHGAFLPLHDREECDTIEQYFAVRDGLWRPTAVVLPLTAVSEPGIILARFVGLCSLQLVFARSLRSCELITDSHTLQASWRGESLAGCSALELGALHSTPDGLPQGLRALLCRASDETHGREGVLFFLGRRGFVPVPGSVPTVWVTTPTRECLDLGVAINGHFSVHTGRARLAEHPEVNRQTAERLASFAGNALSQLFELCLSDWQAARVGLGIDEDVTVADFWKSLWAVLERVSVGVAKVASRGSGEVAARALWSPESGALSGVAMRHPIVPSELPLPMSEFVRGAEVRVVLDEWLASRAETLNSLLVLPSFGDVLQHGTAVSSRVWKTLRTACSDVATPVVVTLASAVQSEIEHDHRFDAERARRMSFVGDNEVQAHLRQLHSDELETALQRAEFMATSGEYEPADELLTSVGDPEERMRAAFAPPHRVLSHEYGKECVHFFLTCRRQMRASAETLAEWAAAASSAGRRQRVIEYLIKGELRDGVYARLREAHRDCWVFSLGRSSSELAGIPESEAIALLAKLGVISGWESLGEAPRSELATAPTRVLDPTAILTAVAEWWSVEHHRQLEAFDRRTYPQVFDPRALANWDPTSGDARRAWLTVFMLGAFHTMGRSTPAQHRSFLEYCNRDGWLDRFATQSDSSEMWVAFLERFFANQVQDSPFLYWMLQLPRIYVLSRWLPEYVEAFLSIDRPGDPPEPFEVLATRASARFQGGGVEAPPLGRVLGLGYCFVIRELRRHGALCRTDIARDCFVPVRRVRELIADLGGPIEVETGSLSQSRDIHQFLVEHLGDEGAEFGGAFDIPLQIFATDSALQSRLIGSTFEDEGGPDDSEW